MNPKGDNIPKNYWGTIVVLVMLAIGVLILLIKLNTY